MIYTVNRIDSNATGTSCIALFKTHDIDQARKWLEWRTTRTKSYVVDREYEIMEYSISDNTGRTIE